MPHPPSRIRRKKERLKWYKEQKEKPCEHCGQCFPVCCMDLHHRDPTIKESTVRKMITDDLSFKRIQAEYDKCSLLCSNCHRILHHIWRTFPESEGKVIRVAYDNGELVYLGI